MGQLEQKSKKRARRGNLEKALLGALVAAGGVGVALLAPGVLQLLKHVDPDWIFKRDPRQRLREVAHRLKKKGLAEFRIEGGKKRLRLTARGERAMSSIWNESFQLKKPRRWDSKWRLVIFDIPEKRRGVRDRIRALVVRLGFLRLQDSVWVYPYDCEELVTLLKTDLKIGRAVLYVIADAIEFDKPLRQHFSLPLE
ncbi:MAG: Transcriptional regulator, PaaX family [Candidatus Adlerbacteria bacterium GW2011_GWB1_54_7]|uniref:Transcriptional regulator, PaaX family n=1 Tax=Candidatus Adlerbacteria bacterium GW2011_GWB1_54_7 TaxID=1618607 RepID=A0A0G2A8I1_9BACT|nr:MAG: Transcriptional regulator, PaaX family [Candidatus Adlerbacteria bacterium GW2011_GWB1_54_7]